MGIASARIFTLCENPQKRGPGNQASGIGIKKSTLVNPESGILKPESQLFSSPLGRGEFCFPRRAFLHGALSEKYPGEHRRRDEEVLHGLCHERHHRACHTGCARRAQARPQASALCHARDGQPLEPALQEIGPHRRRYHR